MRRPPRLPRPATPQRNFRIPPEPGIIEPASGSATNACWSWDYSSSLRYSCARRVNSLVSTKLIIPEVYGNDVLRQHRTAPKKCGLTKKVTGPPRRQGPKIKDVPAGPVDRRVRPHVHGNIPQCELRQQPAENKCAAEEEDSHDDEYKNAISDMRQSRPPTRNFDSHADGRNNETPKRKHETDRDRLDQCSAIRRGRCDLPQQQHRRNPECCKNEEIAQTARIRTCRHIGSAA